MTEEMIVEFETVFAEGVAAGLSPIAAFLAALDGG